MFERATRTYPISLRKAYIHSSTKVFCPQNIHRPNHPRHVALSKHDLEYIEFQDANDEDDYDDD